jgi:hypothetical protein
MRKERQSDSRDSRTDETVGRADNWGRGDSGTEVTVGQR